MFTPMINSNLQLAIAKARETKLREEEATVRLLNDAGSEIRHLRPGTMALFGLLLAKRI